MQKYNVGQSKMESYLLSIVQLQTTTEFANAICTGLYFIIQPRLAVAESLVTTNGYRDYVAERNCPAVKGVCDSKRRDAVRR